MAGYKFESREEGLRRLQEFGLHTGSGGAFHIVPDALPEGYPTLNGHPVALAHLFKNGRLFFTSEQDPTIKPYHAQLRKELADVEVTP